VHFGTGATRTLDVVEIRWPSVDGPDPDERILRPGPDRARKILMQPPSRRHRSQRIGWLRAASWERTTASFSTASLLVGVAAPMHARRRARHGDRRPRGRGHVHGRGRIRVRELQADRGADLDRERQELATDEATSSRSWRGSSQAGLDLAWPGRSRQLMDKDALGAHARDELGMSEISNARPSRPDGLRITFAVGAAMPCSPP